MKSLKHYIAESVHLYDVTIKIAGEVDKNFLDMFIYNLKSLILLRQLHLKHYQFKKIHMDFPVYTTNQ